MIINPYTGKRVNIPEDILFEQILKNKYKRLLVLQQTAAFGNDDVFWAKINSYAKIIKALLIFHGWDND